MTWKTIESAPKTGAHFIAWDPRFGLLFTMHWDKKDERFLTAYEHWSGVFTHWMPLPKAPRVRP